MGILGNMFGMDDDRSSDMGARIALASQVLMAMDQGQVANIAPAIADLNSQRRKYMDQAKSQKWLQAQAAGMADKNPRLAAMLENAPPGVGESLISKYLETQFQPPDWKTFESGGDMYRVDMRDPNAKPSLLFDGPDDPFKALLRSIDPSAGQPPASAPVPGASAEAGAPPSSSSATPDMPPAPSASVLTPQQQVLAQAFGLPPNATVDDVMAVARAGAISEENARATASNIIDRYKTQQSQSFELTQKQIDNSFKLQSDYWRVGQTYKKVIDNATEVAAIIPEDANGFERLSALYKFMRGLDPAGAVRESDAAMAQNADSIVSKADQIIEKYTGMSGGDVPLTAAMEMKRLILELGEVASKADYKERKRTLKRAKDIGIPADKAEGMIFGSLQDMPDDMEGYQPRFQPPARKSDTDMQTGIDPTAAAVTQAPPGTPKITSIEDYNRLVPGTVYITPDGEVKTKRAPAPAAGAQ